jgi:hypothetical protein
VKWSVFIAPNCQYLSAWSLSTLIHLHDLKNYILWKSGRCVCSNLHFLALSSELTLVIFSTSVHLLGCFHTCPDVLHSPVINITVVRPTTAHSVQLSLTMFSSCHHYTSASVGGECKQRKHMSVTLNPFFTGPSLHCSRGTAVCLLDSIWLIHLLLHFGAVCSVTIKCADQHRSYQPGHLTDWTCLTVLSYRPGQLTDWTCLTVLPICETCVVAQCTVKAQFNLHNYHFCVIFHLPVSVVCRLLHTLEANLGTLFCDIWCD